MLRKVKLGEISILGMSLKEWAKTRSFVWLAAFFSSLMVYYPTGLTCLVEIHQVRTEWDKPSRWSCRLYWLIYCISPSCNGGWAGIFLLAPRTFRPTLFAMMTIGLITGIVNITYNTYAARAFVVPTDFSIQNVGLALQS